MGARRLRRMLPVWVALSLTVGFASQWLQVAQAQTVVHIVQPGENLFRIGLWYGVDWRAIMAANGLTSILIYVGQPLVIPSAQSQPSRVQVAAPPTAPPPAAVPTAAPGVPPGTYTVQAGDTVFRIASRYGLTVDQLANANNLYDPRFIFVGQVLMLPGGAGPADPAAFATKQLSVYGQAQALPLDCEARSAVDWAAYFGVAINELDFFRSLPASDDPEIGFVGSVYGAWGQLPPNAYGVHAGPVAALLRAYGVRAQAVRGAAWENLRAEIDAGRPVIAWVTGHVTDGASYVYVSPTTGNAVTVAPFEHTVIVSGYGPETVWVTDGFLSYSRSLDQFLRSWGALGNMAVVAGP